MMLKKGTWILLLFFMISSSTVFANEYLNTWNNNIYPKIKLSTGFGLDYGGAGGNIELQVNQALGIFVGYGTRNIIAQEISGSMENGWSVGSRLYLGQPSTVRAKATLAFGQSHEVFIQDSSGVIVNQETIPGFKFGLGIEWFVWKTLSLDLDAGIAFGTNNRYIYTHNYDNGTSETIRVNIDAFFSPTLAVAWHF